MKISNKLFNDQQLKQFSRNMENIQTVQSKISSGKNIIFASDDPVGAVELSGLKDVVSRVDQFLENIDLANNRLQLMDDTLAGAKNIFIRCNELSIQAANDALGAADRESIAIENVYKNAVLPRRTELKFNNPDIESGYCSSIFIDDCI